MSQKVESYRELPAGVGRWPVEASGRELFVHGFVCKATSIDIIMKNIVILKTVLCKEIEILKPQIA